MKDMEKNFKNTLIISGAFVLAFSLLGVFLGTSLLKFRSFDRTVTVKGLSEREYVADVVIWPIRIVTAGGEAAPVYARLDTQSTRVKSFLMNEGLNEADLSLSIPAVIDKAAREYGSALDGNPRFTGSIIVTIYSSNVQQVRQTMNKIGALGKEGIVLQFNSSEMMDGAVEYQFSKLNEVKPEMIKEAAANARLAAQQFAKDSGSKLGKLKTASQGQFSIRPRDRNNPHLKTVRVVTSMEYYLAD